MSLYAKSPNEQYNIHTFREPCPFWMIVVVVDINLGLLEEAGDGKFSVCTRFLRRSEELWEPLWGRLAHLHQP